MKDKEIIEAYIKNIKEELMMYSDSLSEKSLPYVKCLKKEYNHWEKDLDKLDPNYKEKHKEEKEDDDRTEVDDISYDLIDEYLAYLDYKEDYLNTNDQEKLEMCHQELSHFLSLLTDIFEEISDHSKDSPEERSMIKNTIKQIYQVFG